jgi:hypothetical protein
LRPGYLAALASRTLGVAPVLKPPTPSRFEPESLPPESLQPGSSQLERPQPERPPLEIPQGESLRARSPRARWLEAAQSPQAAPDLSAASPQAPAVADAGLGVTAKAMRGIFGPDLGQGRLAARAALDSRAALAGWDAQEAPADSLRAVPPATDRIPGEVTSGPAMVPRAAAAVSVPEVDLAEAARPEAVLQPLPSGLRPPAAGWTGPSRQQNRAADEPSGAPGAAPIIVVRIGRVDVRAVRAAPPAVSAPPLNPPKPSKPPAGPSLAEYLGARDRGRR